MNRVYLITRPSHDDTTHYLANWSEETIRLAQNKGLKVLDIFGGRAIRAEVTSIFKEKSPNVEIKDNLCDIVQLSKKFRSQEY